MLVIWGYDPATKICHGYGPYADQAAANADAAKAKQLWPTWSVVVQAVEALSTKYPQADPAGWLLWATPFSFAGTTGPSAPTYHAYLSNDPAALDALGAHMGTDAFSYEVIHLEAAVA